MIRRFLESNRCQSLSHDDRGRMHIVRHVARRELWRKLAVSILIATTTIPAHAQVSFRHYQPETTYFSLPLPLNTLILSRFDAVAPVDINEVSIWFVSASKGGPMDVVLLGHEGGYPFPYQMAQLVQPIRVQVPPHTDTLVKLHFQEPISLDRSSQFFVGVIKRSEDVQVRMDRTGQVIPCSGVGRDTMFTSMFALRDAPSASYHFGARYSNQRPINNWYIGAEGNYRKQNEAGLFTDVTEESGLRTPEQANIRVAWGDFDEDGYQDLLWGDHLFRNKRDGTFQDVARAVGYNIGSQVNMFADIDNDGDLDIVCQPQPFVYFNKGGSFSFFSMPGLLHSRATQAMAFGDYNNDSYPDLFVANGESIFVQTPGRKRDSVLVEGISPPSRLYMNDAGKGFIVHTESLKGYEPDAKVKNPVETGRNLTGYRPATCAQWIDIDNDGDLDLFVGTDHLQPNYLFENRGSEGFVDMAKTWNAEGGLKAGWESYFGNTQSCDFADYNNDGAFDMVSSATALPYELAYCDITAIRNADPAASGSFSKTPGPSLPGYTARQGDVAWGDYDNDGLLDLIVTGGSPCVGTTLYRQQPDHSFRDVTQEIGFTSINAMSVAWVDYDNDGDLDIALVEGTTLKLLRNDLPDKGNWVELRLEGKTTNRSAIGARITVYAGGKGFNRFVSAGKGSGSQQPFIQHIGIGSETRIDSVVIAWPGVKKIQTVAQIQPNMLTLIVEAVRRSTQDDPATPQAPDLLQNFPNPFSKGKNASTSIAYNLPAAADIRLEIIDLTGSLVAVLLEKPQSQGLHYVQWDGKNQKGESMPSGSYFYMLSSKGNVLARELILLK